jgi:hypothetical protein
MALDFTVVITVRQRFGGGDEPENALLETDAPFVGRQADFPFQCPNVDPSQPAILLFQSQGVDVPQPMTINGQTVFGGIPRSAEVAPYPGGYTEWVAQWNGNVMLVTPGVLQENNVLHIEALKIGDTDKVDNFIIDNLVVIFKTRARIVVDPGLAR